MQDALSIAEKQCQRYYNAYQACVNRFPETWHLDCTSQKDKFTRCAETHPLISAIKNECHNEFMAYEDCGMRNQDNLDKCKPQLNNFEVCVSRVSDRVNETSSHKSGS